MFYICCNVTTAGNIINFPIYYCTMLISLIVLHNHNCKRLYFLEEIFLSLTLLPPIPSNKSIIFGWKLVSANDLYWKMTKWGFKVTTYYVSELSSFSIGCVCERFPFIIWMEGGFEKRDTIDKNHRPRFLHCRSKNKRDEINC
jgi:hypothetical protein